MSETNGSLPEGTRERIGQLAEQVKNLPETGEPVKDASLSILKAQAPVYVRMMEMSMSREELAQIWANMS
jgi:hypothetical protein